MAEADPIMDLSGAQERQFRDALVHAYSRQRLTELIRFRFEKDLDDIVAPGSLNEVAFELIKLAVEENWVDQLLLAARESNPGNPALLAFAQEFGLAPATPSGPGLESLIKTTNSFLEIAQWRQRLGEIEAQVCRVEIPTTTGKIFGTGFLVGPDLVLTNYHVMERVIEKQGATPESVVLRFDYKRLADGATLNPGKEYRLAADWLVDCSPFSPIDLQPEPKSGLPQPDQLDYALLRTAGSPGSDKIGAAADPSAPARGAITIPAAPAPFAADTAVFIVQHPEGDPLKLALDDDGVIGLNANATRVMYETNTERGSSGSPCFDANWNLIALHHSGDPNFDPAHKPAYNQGIPMSAILTLLRERGHGDKLPTASA